MTLDDCDLPEVRRFTAATIIPRVPKEQHQIHYNDCGCLTEKAETALAALYEKWQEVQAERDKAEAECDRLRATYLALRQQRESDAAVAAPVAVAGQTRPGTRPA
jgi:hypothetical protein